MVSSDRRCKLLVNLWLTALWRARARSDTSGVTASARPGSLNRGVAVLSFAAASMLAAACASTGAVPHPFPMPGVAPLAAPGSPVPPSRAIVGTALALRGTPYRNGGTDPHGFDCSGFTWYVFEQHGMMLPRDVHDQFLVGRPVKIDRLVAGDLLFFSTTAPGPSHVAIAIDSDHFVHAPSTSGVVRVERLRSDYWLPRLVGALRVN
jgi:hypothetical protein